MTGSSFLRGALRDLIPSTGLLTQDMVNEAVDDVTGEINKASGAVSGAVGAADDAATIGAITMPDEAALAVAANNRATWEAAAYVLAVVTLVYLFLLIWMRQAIRDAIKIFEEASKCIKSMPQLVLYPFVTLVLVLLHAFYFFAIMCYIYTSASADFDQSLNELEDSVADVSGRRRLMTDTMMEDDDNGAIARRHFVVATQLDAGWRVSASQLQHASSSSSSSRRRNRALLSFNRTDSYAGEVLNSLAPMDTKTFMILYHFFGFLWTNQFIQGMGLLIIAGAVADWYGSVTHLRKCTFTKSSDD